MAVTGKLLVLIVFVAGILIQSPQMIFRPGLLSALFGNLTEVALNIPIRTRQGHGQKSFLRSDSNSAFVMDHIPVEASKIKHLNQNEAIQVDQELFNEYKFSVDQLMELAGMSVAAAVAKAYESKKNQKILIIAGPGNNGGDGLVAARHLKLFGFQNITVLNAKKPSKELFVNLIHQAVLNDVEVSYDADSFRDDNSIGLLIDALFGFSFKPPVRPDFVPLMRILASGASKNIPVVSVDIPSGWDVEKGPPSEDAIRFMPDSLVSLTAPKLCATHFQGTYHFLGGRFVPKSLVDKYSLNLPPYPGTECVVRLK